MVAKALVRAATIDADIPSAHPVALDPADSVVKVDTAELTVTTEHAAATTGRGGVSVWTKR